jgi:hypothetical protein
MASGSLVAQVNTERLRRSDISDGWFGSTRIDVTLRSGNVDLTLIGIGGRLDHVSGSTQTFLAGSGDFGWQGGERFSNQGLLHLRRTLRTDRAFAPEVFLQANYDKSRALTFRGLAGAGARFTLFARPSWHLVAATAYLLEREVLDLPPTALHPDRTTSHRWSSYVSTRIAAGPRLALVATAYVQPEFENFSDVRVLTDARMALELSGNVSVTMTLNLRYDGEPPDDIDPVDAEWKTGFAVEW